MTTRYMNEALDYIESAPAELKGERLREIVMKNQTFIPLIAMAFVPVESIVGLPEGFPEKYKTDHHIPEGFSEQSLQSAYRRIKNFKANGSMQNLTPEKRLTQWVDLLESFSWREAQIITYIKDKTLNVAYPGIVDLLPLMGIHLTKVPESTVIEPIVTEVVKNKGGRPKGFSPKKTPDAA